MVWSHANRSKSIQVRATFYLPEMLARISQLPDVQVKVMEAQKYLGGLVTKNLQWNSQVLAACSKAKRTLGFLRRLTFDTHDQRARKLL